MRVESLDEKMIRLGVNAFTVVYGHGIPNITPSGKNFEETPWEIVSAMVRKAIKKYCEDKMLTLLDFEDLLLVVMAYLVAGYACRHNSDILLDFEASFYRGITYREDVSLARAINIGFKQSIHLWEKYWLIRGLALLGKASDSIIEEMLADPFERTSALRVIAIQARPEHFDLLQEALKGGSLGEKVAAAYGLGRIGNKDAIVPLRALAEELDSKPLPWDCLAINVLGALRKLQAA